MLTGKICCNLWTSPVQSVESKSFRRRTKKQKQMGFFLGDKERRLIYGFVEGNWLDSIHILIMWWPNAFERQRKREKRTRAVPGLGRNADWIFLTVEWPAGDWENTWQRTERVTILAVSGVPRNFVLGRGVNKFNWGQREWGSGGGSRLVRGSGGSCNLVQEISFRIVKFS